jgi:hypothetical protein
LAGFPVWLKLRSQNPIPGLPEVKVESVACMICVPFLYAVMVLPMAVALRTSPVLMLHCEPEFCERYVKLPKGPFHLTISQYAVALVLARNRISYPVLLLADSALRNRSSTSAFQSPPVSLLKTTPVASWFDPNVPLSIAVESSYTPELPV